MKELKENLLKLTEEKVKVDEQLKEIVQEIKKVSMKPVAVAPVYNSPKTDRYDSFLKSLNKSDKYFRG